MSDMLDNASTPIETLKNTTMDKPILLLVYANVPKYLMRPKNV